MLAAGIPADWLAHGIGIAGLRTHWGPLAYRLRSVDGHLQLEIDAGLEVPPGGFVLPWARELGADFDVDSFDLLKG